MSIGASRTPFSAIHFPANADDRAANEQRQSAAACSTDRGVAPAEAALRHADHDGVAIRGRPRGQCRRDDREEEDERERDAVTKLRGLLLSLPAQWRPGPGKARGRRSSPGWFGGARTWFSVKSLPFAGFGRW